MNSHVALRLAAALGAATLLIVTLAVLNPVIPSPGPIQIDLRRPGRVLVTVVSTGGVPVDDARVELVHESGVDLFRDTRRAVHEPRTDDTGRLLIPGVAPGVYRLRAFRARPASGSPVTVRVLENRRHDLVLTLREQ